MTEFQFVDELPDRKHSSRGRAADPLIVAFADALRSNPGQWAKWPKNVKNDQAARTTAYRIHAKTPGCPKALAAPEFEALTRSGTTYVRYVPGDAS